MPQLRFLRGEKNASVLGLRLPFWQSFSLAAVVVARLVNTSSRAGGSVAKESSERLAG